MTSTDCLFGPTAHLTAPLLRSLHVFDSAMLLPWSSFLPQYHKQRRAVPRLPYEDCLVIIRIYIDDLIKSQDVRGYRIKRETFKLNIALVALMLVSKPFRELACREWNLYWSPFPALPNTWILYRPIVYFETLPLPVDLSVFTYLRFASLPADRAVEYRDGAWHLRPLVVNLPPYIEELEFVRSHASEADLIHLAGRLCPWITKLRVVHCTMFNHPECPWWYNHQLDQDHHYLKGDDLSTVTAYAESISIPLQGLPRIEHVHLGTYFIPFRAVTIHRTHPAHTPHHPVRDRRAWIDHISYRSPVNLAATWAAQHPGIPPPDPTWDRLAPLKLWETECPKCVQDWTSTVERAEQRAASVLAARVPTLRTASFASFVADKRTAPSEWEVSRVVVECQEVRDAQRLAVVDARLYVSTKRPGASCSSRVWQSFRRFGAEWVIVE